MRIHLLLAGVASFFLAALDGPAPSKNGYQVEPFKEAPPADVAEKVREVLVPEALRVLDKKGGPVVDVWLRKSMPTVEGKQELGVRFSRLQEGTLLGVIRFLKKSNDFKGNDFPAGVFTMRSSLQPIDGDHQGVSETRDFVLLSPVKVDTAADPMSTKEAIKLSVQVSGIKHPTVLWLMKVTEEGAKLPRMVEDETLALWILECEVPAAAKESAKASDAVRLGLVLVGKAAEQ